VLQRAALPATREFERLAMAIDRRRTRGVLRDEVVAERKIVYLRNVGQGSSGLEGEACSTPAMSSQRRSGTAPR
jgi:hypothetical protein